MAKKARKFSQNITRQPGELARLKIIRGRDSGAVFVLFDERATLGRGDSADVQILDLKASRIHAEIMRNGRSWYVRDLGSANGVFFQGSFTRQAKLVNGATFAVGETRFEFMSAAESNTQMLMAPPKNETQVVREQNMMLAHENRIAKITTVGGIASDVGGVPGIGGGGSKIRPTQIFLAIAIAVLVLLPEKKQEGGKVGEGTRVAAVEARRAIAVDHKPNPTAKKYYKEGFREFREGNYIRAIGKFELAVRVDPDFKKAQDAMVRCREEVKRIVADLMKEGIRAQKAGKLKSAIGHFEAVKRLLIEKKDDENYLEADRRLQEVRKELQDRTT